MSGSTIGGFAGAIVGSFFGAPQLGFMIGSAIGGYLDPQRIEGPRLKDASVQTSQDGVPIPFGYGVFPCAGNVIWRDKLVEHKKGGGGGKGGGPSVTEYRYTRSYAIGICQGPITGILMIKRNGKNVYDARSPWEILQEYMDASDDALEMWANIHRWMAAMRRRFMNRATIYFGTEDQMPDPTIESVVGVGNVSAFRGLAYMVVKDDDLTDTGGAIPQYEFVVANQGEVTPYSAAGLEVGRLSRFENADWPLVDQPNEYTYTGRRRIDSVNYVEYSADTIDEIIEYFGTIGFAGVMHPAPSVYLGYSASTASEPDTFQYSGTTEQPDITDNTSIILVYNSYDVEGYIDSDDGTGSDACPLIPSPDVPSPWYAFNEGAIGQLVDDSHPGTGHLVTNCVDGLSDKKLLTIPPLYIKVERKRIAPAPEPPDDAVRLPDVPSYYVMPDGTLVLTSEYTETTGTFRILAEAYSEFVTDRHVYLRYEQGPVVEQGEADYDNEAFWTAAYDAAVTAGDLPAGWTYGVEYPVTVSQVWEEAPVNSNIVAPEKVALGTIVAGFLERAGLTPDDYDVSDLTDLVDGYRVATEAGADAMIAPLQQAYFFDVGEWDGKLRFVKRGGDALYTIGPDDFVERDGDAVDLERVQEAELLRKVTVGYLDPRAVYTPTTQKAERRAGTIQAKGEGSVELPIVAEADAAATMAKKRLAVAWSETDKLRFTLSQKWAKVTPTDVCEVQLPDGNTLRARIMSVEEDSGRFEVEAIRDRQAAYTGTATGVRPPPPTITDPPLVGPTRLVVMDLPALSESDDALGVYVAARGYFAGWTGAEVQISTDAGATYSPVTQATRPATIGYTTTDLSAWVSAEYPSTQSVTVYLPDAPESVDYAKLLRYNNRAALQLDDGTWEVLQYQTVTANGSNSYTLSGLLRGRYNTTPGAAASGATFVLLDGYVGFVPCERWMLDQTFKVRAVSYGTDPDAATGTDFTLTGASQTEWPPHFVQASRDGSDSVTVTWIGRGRLGAETNPFHSQYFTGYRVTFSDGHTADVTDTTYTRSSTPPGVTVSVAALNSITGAGPSSETVAT